MFIKYIKYRTSKKIISAGWPAAVLRAVDVRYIRIVVYHRRKKMYGVYIHTRWAVSYRSSIRSSQPALKNARGQNIYTNKWIKKKLLLSLSFHMVVEPSWRCNCAAITADGYCHILFVYGLMLAYHHYNGRHDQPLSVCPALTENYCCPRNNNKTFALEIVSFLNYILLIIYNII